MFKEILFCGKAIHSSSKIVYGDFQRDKQEDDTYRYYIIEDSYTGHEVDPETIGQYIDKKDMHGEKIFSNSYLMTSAKARGSNYYKIAWNNKHACYTCIEDGVDEDIDIKYNLISNIKLDMMELCHDYEERFSDD